MHAAILEQQETDMTKGFTVPSLEDHLKPALNLSTFGQWLARQHQPKKKTTTHFFLKYLILNEPTVRCFDVDLFNSAVTIATTL